MRLFSIESQDNRLVASFKHEYGAFKAQHTVDQVVIEAGTLSADEIYDTLLSKSRNQRQIDIATYLNADGQPSIATSVGEGFVPFRIGDATVDRGIHAAVYDVARLCSRL